MADNDELDGFEEAFAESGAPMDVPLTEVDGPVDYEALMSDEAMTPEVVPTNPLSNVLRSPAISNIPAVGPGGRFAADVLDDVINNPEANIIEQGTMGIGAGLGTMLAPGFGTAAGMTVGGLAGRKINDAIGARPEGSGDTLSLQTGVDVATNFAGPLFGKALKGNAAKREAASLGDSFAVALRQPEAQSKFGRQMRAELNKAQSYFRGRGRAILDGADSYDVASNSFRFSNGKKRGKLTAEEVLQNIDGLLNGKTENVGGVMQQTSKGLRAQRDELLNKVETAARVENLRTERIDNPLTFVTENDLRSEFGNVIGKARKMQGTANDEYANELLTQTENLIQTIMGNADPKLGATPAEISRQLEGVYGRMKQLEAQFHTDPKMMSAAKDAELDALREASFRLRQVRDRSIEKILGVPNISAAVSREGFNKNSIQGINDAIHNLLTLDKSLDATSFNAAVNARRQTEALASAPLERPSFTRAGVTGRLFDAGANLIGQGSDTALLRSQRGIVGDTARVLDFGGKPAGPLERLGNILDSPTGVIAGHYGIPLADEVTSSPEARADMLFPQGAALRNELVNIAQKNGIARTPEVMPMRFPRETKVLMANKDEFIRRATEVAMANGANPDEAMMIGSEIDKVLSATGPQSTKATQLGTLLGAFPSLAAVLEPSKSGANSELDGMITSEEDLVGLSEALEQSGMSLREQALAHKSLWGERRYKGPSLLTQVK